MQKILFIDGDPSLAAAVQAAASAFSCRYASSFAAAAEVPPADVVCINCDASFSDLSALSLFLRKTGTGRRPQLICIAEDPRRLIRAFIPDKVTKMQRAAVPELAAAVIRTVLFLNLSAVAAGDPPSAEVPASPLSAAEPQPVFSQPLTGDKQFLIGSSQAMAEVRETIFRYAPMKESVLILGETGTGKELAATMLHAASGRTGNLVAVNSSALPRSLAEAQLFGFEKGTFTDAKRSHSGFFEQAHRGTLFLDEIGDLESSLQPKLLRVIESGEVQRLGSARTSSVDVRIAAATNIPAEELYLRKIMRSDLFFRIQTLSLFIPPLRERREDIVELSEWFLARCRPRFQLSPESARLLTGCDWPGNVRQLFSVLKRSLLLPSPESRRSGELQINEALLKPFYPGSPSAVQECRRREEFYGV